ncbi:VanW family protein [Flaviflexus equikiangi]|uniref:VanW family protein n=1 Tax=Flaviflexus equikiangi TaxID=2758573 RepID=UPI0015F68E90|nr:VanW family protein [Flaviflexus equikiangi]
MFDDDRTSEWVPSRAVDDAESPRALWPFVAAAIALVLVVVYIGMAFFFADRIPTNTTIAGVDVGGMSEEAAAEKLEADLAGAVSDPVPVTVAGTDITAEIDPTAASVAIDGAATVEGLTGLSFNPAHLLRHLSGSDDVDPVVSFDEAALSETIRSLNEQLGTRPVDATISFAGSTIQTTHQVNGTGIDAETAVRILGQGWVSQTRPIELEPVDLEPDVTDKDVERVRAEQAEPLVASPLTVSVGERDVVLEPQRLAEAASFTADNGELTMIVDTAALVDQVIEGAGDELEDPKNAEILIEDHAVGPIIRPGRSGMVINTEATGEAIGAVVTTSTRTVEAVVTEEEPEFSTADAEALGIVEVVSEISTPLTNDPVRTQNLIVGTSKTNNTLVLPGEEFSLLTTLGPITEENGFVSSGVVVDGFNAVALGGGLSQLSTNTFNLGYRAGMEDIQHQPHSKYFDRYPMGVEATLWVPSVDMRWRNSSPFGVLVETWVEGGQVRSRLWSTAYYDVDITVSDPYKYVQPTTEVNTSPDCVPYAAGGPGFTVDVTRIVRREGEMIYNNSYSWTYQPVHAAVCG